MALPFRTASRANGRPTVATSSTAAQTNREPQPLRVWPVADAWPSPLAPAHRTQSLERAANGPLSETRRCEAALLDDLLALLAALRLPVDALPERPVSVAALGAALAELERAERGGLLPADAADARRRRLLALSGASANLGALLDQRRRGLLPDAPLHVRRAGILDRLAPFITADEA